jgi:hypothetical protein
VIPKATTLTEVIDHNRKLPRKLTYLEGENDAREVSFGELYERALTCSASGPAAATS